MIIDWPRFLTALVFLLLPIGLFHSDRVHYRTLAADWDGYWQRTLSLGMHSIDLVRAILGGWLLVEAVAMRPEVSGSDRLQLLGVQSGVLALATVVQATVFRKHRIVHAPIAFVIGLAFGFLPVGVAAFAVPLAAAFAFGGKIPAWFFPFLAAGVCIGGVLFSGASRRIDAVVMAIASLLPWLITLLFRREFVSSYRARPKTTIANSPP